MDKKLLHTAGFIALIWSLGHDGALGAAQTEQQSMNITVKANPEGPYQHWGMGPQSHPYLAFQYNQNSMGATGLFHKKWIQNKYSIGVSYTDDSPNHFYAKKIYECSEESLLTHDKIINDLQEYNKKNKTQLNWQNLNALTYTVSVSGTPVDHSSKDVGPVWSFTCNWTLDEAN